MLELLSKHVGSSFFSIETWCDFGLFFIHRKILCRIHIDFVWGGREGVHPSGEKKDILNEGFQLITK
jgi:hypothetical protein